MKRRFTAAILVILAGMLAIAAATPSPTVQVDSMVLTLSSARVAEDQIVLVDLVADRIPSTGMAGFSIRVSTVASTTARAILFDSPSYGIERVDQFDSTLRLSIADFNDVLVASSTNVILGTVHFLGVAAGTTPIKITVDRIDDLDGSPIPTSGSAGAITVFASRDLDGDGLTEDFNGNGVFDFADLLALFNLLIPPP